MVLLIFMPSLSEQQFNNLKGVSAELSSQKVEFLTAHVGSRFVSPWGWQFPCRAQPFLRQLRTQIYGCQQQKPKIWCSNSSQPPAPQDLPLWLVRILWEKNPNPAHAAWNKSLAIPFLTPVRVWLRLPTHLLSLGVCQRFLYLFFRLHHVLQVVMLIGCLFMSKL